MTLVSAPRNGVSITIAAAGADEELFAEFALERLQTRRQRRLIDETCLRGAAQTAVSRDLKEAFDLPHEHGAAGLGGPSRHPVDRTEAESCRN